MIRALVAEDSVTVRRLLVEILDADPQITVIAEATNGVEAVEKVVSLEPDLVVMDIHMPMMDGLEATRQIMRRAPTPILIVSAAADQEQLELSFSATQAGALLVLPKPAPSLNDRVCQESRHLLAMAKAMAKVKVVRRWAPRLETRTPPPRMARTEDAPPNGDLVAIAASTGGPAALRTLLNGLPPDFAAPILVVQHIAPGFIAGFAEWLGRECPLRVEVAQEGEPFREHTVYIAPDERHLGVSHSRNATLSDASPIDGFRPSATYLFESVAHAANSAAVGVVLTGMGSDGVAGLRTLYSKGGHILVQDQESSVVHGMAGEAVRLGLAHEALPLDEIAERLATLVTRATL